ncbi:MAG: KEOPS complex subunit Pcc1 [Candidatus Kariarchaeaceae archaeon]|jgi:tRNA threonylcarbamoyladenosine modification (KEOPS) complex  Pcc1 subunit
MTNSVEIQITIPNPDVLLSIYTAIQVETNATEINRGSIHLRIRDSELVVSVIAEDLVATRALTNSIMRLIKTSVDVASVSINTDNQNH